MVKRKDYRILLEKLEKTPLAILLTNEDIMKEYRDYLEDIYSRYLTLDDIDDDDKYLLEDKLDSFNEMMGDKGQAIILELFSDVYYGQILEIINGSRQFAEKFAESDNFMEVTAWDNEFGEYLNFIEGHIRKLKSICNPPKSKKRKSH